MRSKAKRAAAVVAVLSCTGALWAYQEGDAVSAGQALVSLEPDLSRDRGAASAPGLLS